MRNISGLLAVAIFGLLLAPPATRAQVPLDRADPTINQRSVPRPEKETQTAPRSATVQKPNSPIANIGNITPLAITVEGAREVPAFAFTDLVAEYVGRSLTNEDLARLANQVADTARRRGYPLATAYIAPQPAGGLLKVTLEEGSIDAVRVVGVANPLADKILSKALITGRPTRQSDLERAILLVTDIPGLSVKESRFVKQNGFGIMLITIEQKRVSAYAQIDNRGSDEVGPLRSTILASLRGLATSGDELGVIVSQTPLQPSEFYFLRGRYGTPVGADGGSVAFSASYGRSNPGAALKQLNVVGESTDFALAYSRPLKRSRASSYFVNFTLRKLRIEQQLAGTLLRDDKLTTFTAALNGVKRLGGGILRSEIATTAGLPLAGVSREGDPMLSRADGDARFVTLNLDLEWTVPVAPRVSIMLSSSGQLASRPLLATAEIGAGGPQFGRAYDFAERTGDQGILGIAELRYDARKVLPAIFDRLQVYTSVDGGYIDNLRRGFGGGSLLSSSIGIRAGKGRLDGMVELSMPLNADRFDTQNRDPRIAIRISRSF